MFLFELRFCVTPVQERNHRRGLGGHRESLTSLDPNLLDMWEGC
jgi:hypothetical protein